MPIAALIGERHIEQSQFPRMGMGDDSSVFFPGSTSINYYLRSIRWESVK
jgi:hypothetical protein